MSSLVVDRSPKRPCLPEGSVEQPRTAKSSSTLKYWTTGIGIILGLVNVYLFCINPTLGHYKFSGKAFSF